MYLARWNGTHHYIDPKSFHPNWQPSCKAISRRRNNGTDHELRHLSEWMYAKTRQGFDACDAYSMGGGLCIMQAWRRDDNRDERQKERDLSQMKSSCASQMLTEPGSTDPPKMELQFLHCPSLRPLAIFVVPKCGTTSTINWVADMDVHEHRKNTEIAKMIIEHGPNAAVNHVAWQLGEDFPDATVREDHIRLADRMMYRYSVPEVLAKTDRIKFLPPAGYCPMCCARGHGRQKVIMGRNPFVRLVSYYKMKVIHGVKGDEIHPQFFKGWKDFEHWIYAVLSHRETAGGFTHNLRRFRASGKYSCKPDPECDPKGQEKPYCPSQCYFASYIVSASDVYHIRPVVDQLRDNRFDAYRGNMDSLIEGYHIIHMETIKEDIESLEKKLCQEYNDCDPLPPYPRVYPGVDTSPTEEEFGDICDFDPRLVEFINCSVSWKDLWTPTLREIVIVHYQEDFKLLGYTTDPLDPMPLQY